MALPAVRMFTDVETYGADGTLGPKRNDQNLSTHWPRFWIPVFLASLPARSTLVTRGMEMHVYVMTTVCMTNARSRGDWQIGLILALLLMPPMVWAARVSFCLWFVVLYYIRELLLMLCFRSSGL